MKTGKKLMLALILLCIAAAGAVLLILPHRQQNDGWTVMVYMVGSDLESRYGLLTKDLEEMRSAVREDTRLIVMMGGSERRNADAGPGGCGIYHVTGREVSPISSCADGMGSPEALRALLRAGMENASGHTALILWDHGYGAMEGFGKDERYADSTLTLTELEQALSEGLQGRRLSLLGFDACLMASAETALTVSDYADYLVASQETEPPEGWDYAFLSCLTPAAEPGDAGKEIIRSYQAFYSRHYADFPQLRQPYTLSLTALNGFDRLADALDAFLGSLGDGMADGGFSRISRIRSSAWAYGRTTTTTAFDLIDVGYLAEKYREENEHASGVLQALDACVIQRQGTVESASGLSLYFPQRALRDDRLRWREAWRTLPLGQGWKRFLEDMESRLDSGRELIPLQWDDSGFSVALPDDLARDFDRAKYFVLEEGADGGVRLIYASGEYTLKDGVVTAPYQGRCLLLSTARGALPLTAFFIQDDARSAYYQAYAGILQDADATPQAIRMRIVKDKASGEWQVLSAFEQSDGPVTGRQEIRLEEQSEIWLVNNVCRPTLNADGLPVPFDQWEIQSQPDVCVLYPAADGLSLAEAPLPRTEGSRYYLQLVVVDTYQTEYASPLFPL